jgi:UDP-glucose 4-epimerase
MRVLLTGAASPLGAGVLDCLLADERNAEVWCGVHRREVPTRHARLRTFPLSLDAEVSLEQIPAPLDRVVHFAGVTHAEDGRLYWDVNYRGTIQLAERARERGCRRFVYVSTRCATEACGAYGASKLAAEGELQRMDWESLLILRPSEIYGGGGREGVDKFITLAERFHLVPVLWGDAGLGFAPMRADDFIAAVCALLAEDRSGVSVLEMCGPENLGGAELAWRIARRYRALPLPLWWPALRAALAGLRRVGLKVVTPDQVSRLVGRKTATESSPDPALRRKWRRFLRE